MGKLTTDLKIRIEACLRDAMGEWDTESERLLLAASMAEGVPAASAMTEIAGRMVDRLREEDEEAPMRDDKDLSKDLVYRLGVRRGLRMAREIPLAARSIIEEQRKGT